MSHTTTIGRPPRGHRGHGSRGLPGSVSTVGGVRPDPEPSPLAFRSHELPYAVTDAKLEIEDPSPHPEQAMQVRQTRAFVVDALDQVPMKRRAVLVMHDIDQVSMRDVASVLGIPVFTAYSRLRKARMEFRAAAEALRKEGGLP